MINSKTETLISVILPVYNVVDYIDDCINSIINQSYDNFELIIVDDKSTDGSSIKCDSYLQMDSRIKVIHREKNGGLSEARNTGLAVASGDFVCFIDSDDYIHKEYLNILLCNSVKYDADISMCDYSKVQMTLSDTNIAISNNVSELSMLQLAKDLATTGIDSMSEKRVVTWNKLFRREIFNNLTFPDKWHEDEFMIHEYIKKSRKMVVTDAKLYYYRQRTDSITGRNQNSNIKHLDLLEAQRERLQIFNKDEYKDAYSELLNGYFKDCLHFYKILRSGENKEILKKDYLLSKVMLKNSKNVNKGSDYLKNLIRMAISRILIGK